MKKILLMAGCALLAVACMSAKAPSKSKISDAQAIENAKKQMGLQIQAIEADKSGKVLNPVTTKRNRFSTGYCGYADWRSGFFPGSTWYLYELTGDKSLLPLAVKYTEAISQAKTLTWHHDIGFIINCSFGNGLRLADKPEYRDVMIEAAKSLCTRFREGAGVIQSWNVTGDSWQAKRGWECPVIIDNMMNLELLFEATKLSGDSTYYKVAVKHADNTLKNHFRPDASCYHVVDYALADGAVRHRQTAQGFADESVWSRGQAWAIYGYTMCYRYTKDPRYLAQAISTFDFMKNHPDMPADLIPYWDMSADDIPNEPRDASSAAVIASALYEMSIYDAPRGKEFKSYADKMMQSLASADYTAKPGENGRFILMHSVGSIPHNSEIDVPLNYADYYYLEALKRKRDLEKKKK
ncbi:MAG: glycoside hydrolase family 88 protein [Muribaculaceae bacterium]|nr:glycoside hydrolase family 88 protein [Muribaculaceae bacterium]